METKLNIAEILKDKPKGTKLYADAFGELSLECVTTNIISTRSDVSSFHNFYGNGKYSSYGEPILFPSKEMRDWSKFAWKKGDLLVNSCGFQCIFKEWASDDYTKFNGCYSNNREGYEDISNARTDKFDKLDNNVAYRYIREIEKRLGGKLNIETLEIEKTQPEFKDGDILYAADWISGYIYIAKEPKSNIDICYCYKLSGEGYLHICNLENPYDCTLPSSTIKEKETRFATEDEKKVLFAALEKENKAWDAEKKQIVDLKLNWTPKTFDRVITRDFDDGVWSANIFSHMNSQGEYVSIGCVEGYAYCLPYNEETAKLIGTTNNAE